MEYENYKSIVRHLVEKSNVQAFKEVTCLLLAYVIAISVRGLVRYLGLCDAVLH